MLAPLSGEVSTLARGPRSHRLRALSLGGVRHCLLLGLFDHADEGLDLLDGLGRAPEEHAVDVPVAALERAAVQVVDRLAQDQRARRERAADERLPADVDGLVLEGLVLVFRQQHGASPPEGRVPAARRGARGAGLYRLSYSPTCVSDDIERIGRGANGCRTARICQSRAGTRGEHIAMKYLKWILL